MPARSKRRQISGDSLKHRTSSVDEIFIEAGKVCVMYKASKVCVMYKAGKVRVMYKAGKVCGMYKAGYN